MLKKLLKLYNSRNAYHFSKSKLPRNIEFVTHKKLLQGWIWWCFCDNKIMIRETESMDSPLRWELYSELTRINNRIMRLLLTLNTTPPTFSSALHHTDLSVKSQHKRESVLDELIKPLLYKYMTSLKRMILCEKTVIL